MIFLIKLAVIEKTNQPKKHLPPPLSILETQDLVSTMLTQKSKQHCIFTISMTITNCISTLLQRCKNPPCGGSILYSFHNANGTEIISTCSEASLEKYPLFSALTQNLKPVTVQWKMQSYLH